VLQTVPQPVLQPVPQGRPQPAPQSAPDATAQRKPRLRARTAVPAAAIAATLAAGAATYALASPGQPSQAKLTAALSSPLVIDAFTHSGVGDADAASTVLVPPGKVARVSVARATEHIASVKPAASPAKSATATPAATQPAASQPAASQSSQSPAATATAAPTPSASASASSTHTASTVSCSDNSYLLPANVTAIVSFLVANGYSDNAAAGIAGNMYQESKGDPESVGMGGGGLIGFTPLPAGYVTGNPATDLQTQLNAVLTYNQIWASYIPALNSAATPADAADIYVTDFERAGIPAAGTREASAEAVASACNI
jgi:Phage tail lysozyme